VRSNKASIKPFITFLLCGVIRLSSPNSLRYSPKCLEKLFGK